MLIRHDAARIWSRSDASRLGEQVDQRVHPLLEQLAALLGVGQAAHGRLVLVQHAEDLGAVRHDVQVPAGRSRPWCPASRG